MSAFDGTPLAGGLWMNQGGLYQHIPPSYQQQQQAYQQIAGAYQYQYGPTAPPLPGLVGGEPLKAKKYVHEFEWLRGRVNEVMWK